jgi:hypothetical protein
MPHFQQRIAVLAAVDDRVERIFLVALLVDALEPGFVGHNVNLVCRSGRQDRCLPVVQDGMLLEAERRITYWTAMNQ